MRVWSECSGGGSFTASGWCLAVLCVAPVLVDVAACDEFNAAPLHQPVLVDGEQVDPSEDTAGPLSHDHHLPDFSTAARPLIRPRSQQQSMGSNDSPP